VSKIAFLFPGQGAQKVGMGRELASSLPAAHELYDRASAVLGYDLAQICFEGPAEKLDSTIHSQPAIFVTSLAALEQFRTQSPDVVASCSAAAGLSLGEYTALVFAGVMDFETALNVVQKRGQAMQDASDATASGMVSVLGPDRVGVETLCEQAREGEVLQVANLLCPGNTVVSGTKAACQRLVQKAEAAGARTIALSVAGAFHTSIMHPADERLAAALSGARLSRPRIPVVSNVDAKPHDDSEEIRRLLVEQVIRPVQWEDCVRYLIGQGCDQFYEIGPGRVLKGLMRRIDKGVKCENVEA
jgi:[acyl-carrier-protein] S-malonyltransferase